ncbi:DNA protecting protein DprA [Candidatus Falkowbacteria bacterium RIFOXYB2_FULL_47_14]|uniref:DNA protecting protein DprA n=1 Tax=Candidatus Falkowbacteria bacterium RIFOXYA2_FULL_47_19 TaxID=1797994 RepID=A0A1F5SHS8_9BACT|nr:MAG: DNA protecting protein DprA [Candidatus Falkowbacteria bacterium RIFOXYA2_FULL_47_19]OGF36716.1 MAG: DNA protecting protein DprA [Candidatus Falkowbacteria bacterium RIFOXYC2_FULL_46_15]OGF42457.1 MAG: DNA protecting protein DprA [Candidatus Falkowbacteria bacterium RIFOXYB2_FULL_47_14]
MPDDIKYKVALNNFPKFGPVRLKKLKKYFPDAEHIFKASSEELIRAGIEGKTADEFAAARKSIDPDALWEKVNKENIAVIALEDDDYPNLLKEIYDPPHLLYYRGEIDKKNGSNLAVVGTRKFSPYGKQVTETLVSDLVNNNFTVISGLALGIDTLAHNAALSLSGRTIAVLGTGLDKKNLYPSSNLRLADMIAAEGGAIVSEFPLGTPPLKHNFPQRNRIISGMTLGTIVIEAGERSGALITARYALEQNREVFAVPGNIYSPVSVGPNNLIKAGAKPVTTASEIMETLDLTRINTYIENKKIMPASREEEIILANITYEPQHIDELIRLTGLDTARINSTLIIMEMKGMVKNLGNMQYVLSR